MIKFERMRGYHFFHPLYFKKLFPIANPFEPKSILSYTFSKDYPLHRGKLYEWSMEVFSGIT